MIVVECNADKLFINRMGFSKKTIHHAGCKGKVLEIVRKSKKAVGIIDEDPDSEQPGEFKRYNPVEKGKAITLLKKSKDDTKYLIRISPDLEHWILKRAKENKINPKNFSLPDTPGALHSLTRIKKNKKFIDFLSALINADSEIKKIQEWIRNVLK